MQVSKIVIGVNIAATLSVALTGQAKANEKTLDFLKSSLKELSGAQAAKPNLKASKAKVAKPNPASIAKYSSHKSVAVRTAIDLESIKKIKFDPTKKLPTRHELALKEQKAKMDRMKQQATLSASVNAYAPFYLSSEVQSAIKSPKAKRSMTRQRRAQASRKVQKAASVVANRARQTRSVSVHNQNPVMPGQVGHPCASINSMDMHNFETRANLHTGSSIANSIHKQEGPRPPHFTAQEQAELAKMAKVLFLKNKLQDKSSFHSPLDSKLSSRQRVDRAYSKNGPPPFPLNLVPEPAMKDFLSRARNRKSMIKSYPSAFARKRTNLSHSGFHSYAKTLGHGGFGSYSRSATNFSHHYARASAGYVSHARSHSHHKPTHINHHATHKVSLSNKNVIHKAHAKVATYGPYSSRTGFRGL